MPGEVRIRIHALSLQFLANITFSIAVKSPNYVFMKMRLHIELVSAVKMYTRVTFPLADLIHPAWRPLVTQDTFIIMKSSV